MPWMRSLDEGRRWRWVTRTDEDKDLRAGEADMGKPLGATCDAS
jgi:hypothetical protein